MNMPPKQRTIIPPKNGWEERTYYIVEAAFRTTNPIHRYIFYSGFLNGTEVCSCCNTRIKGIPGGYNGIITTENKEEIHQLHYLKVIEIIAHNSIGKGVVKGPLNKKKENL